MSFDNPWQWSATAASNIAITSIDITGATGKVKDGDNALRAIMAGWATVNAKGSDVVSAATLTLGSQRYYHITGSTGPITDIDFTDAVDGRWAWLIFDSTPTLTHNATTLKLPGGANIVAAAGDRALFVQDATDNVICLDYIPAASAPLTVSVIREQEFNASGTYTPHANMVYCIIECIGSGGGGGGVTTSGTGGFHAGGGGGSGSYSRIVASKATIGASQTVTIGAAGTGSSGADGTNGSAVSVGTICVANGGSGGQVASSAGLAGRGGAGGTAGTGTITVPGAVGGKGMYATILTVYTVSGEGAASVLGGGGLSAVPAGSTAVAGVAATANSGAGGSGALVYNLAANAAGGNGGTGYVLITEFCSA
jgi:hypothetical protein